MKKITICSKFDLFPDNTMLGSSFGYSNFNFISKSGISIMVNETAGEKGITIRPIGTSVTFPTSVNYVAFRVGIWDGNSINVIAKNENGQIITQRSINGINQYIDSSITGENIQFVDFDTNGNEELLVSICIDIIAP